MAIEHTVAELYAVADDRETEILDDLRLRSGQLWICACKWRNPGDEDTCGSCGEERTPQ